MPFPGAQFPTYGSRSQPYLDVFETPPKTGVEGPGLSAPEILILSRSHRPQLPAHPENKCAGVNAPHPSQRRMEEKGQERRGPFPGNPLQPPAQSELTAVEGRCRASGKGEAAEEQKGSSPPFPASPRPRPQPPWPSQNLTAGLGRRGPRSWVEAEESGPPAPA